MTKIYEKWLKILLDTFQDATNESEWRTARGSGVNCGTTQSGGLEVAPQGELPI